MDSIHFEAACVPAQTLSLYELAETFFRYKPNINVKDANNIKKGFSLLFEVFPNTDTGSFCAASLLQYQQYLVSKGYCRSYVNKLIKFVRSVFNWGVLYNLVTPALAYSLKLVPPVKYGVAKENAPRKDVPVEMIETVLPYLPPVIADMLRLQLLTAMRPSEVCRMKVGEIEQRYDGEHWLYLPTEHKTKHKGKIRSVLLGIAEQDILKRYLSGKTADMHVFLHSRNLPFTSCRFSQTLQKIIKRNGLPKFTPYQLRHTALTGISAAHGRDAARAVAGHSSIKTTAIYDHSDILKAKKVIASRQKMVVGGSFPVPDRPALRIFTGE
jgi:integrase